VFEEITAYRKCWEGPPGYESEEGEGGDGRGNLRAEHALSDLIRKNKQKQNVL
jgi:hypothetical protein